MRIVGALLILGAFIRSAAASPPPVILGTARFTVLTPQVIRMEYSPSGHFVDLPSFFAIHRDIPLSPEESAAIHIEKSDRDLSIDTGRIQLHYIADGKPFSSDNLHARIRSNPADPSSTMADWGFGMPNTHNLGGTLQRLDYTPHAIPLNEGLLSRDGWYYLEDSQRFLLSPDFENGWVTARPANTDQTDGFLFGYGLDFASALHELTRISGREPLPRKYAMGAWYSRWWPYTSDDYRSIIQEFHDHDFPLDMLVMDMDWHHPDGWTGLSWNRDLLPDAEQLLKDIHAAGLHVTLNDHPQEGVKPTEDRYDEFMRAMGQDPSSQKTLTYDAGNKKYIETLLEVTHTPLEKDGVDFWWLDWMGDNQGPFNTISWMNELYYRHSEESLPQKDLRGMSFSRYADWGDQRHPIHFSGDMPIGWSGLQFEVPFTATANNAGVFYWSHDIGGFINNTPFDHFFDLGDLVARWTQFGATSAALRLHSANKAWLDKRPWTHTWWPGGWMGVEDSMRASFHLRSELFPFIYSSAWRSFVTGVGFDRPLYIDYPASDDAYQNPQEYLWGDAFLVAPITTKRDFWTQKASQNVWFPDGRWFDWFTHQEMAGNTSTSVEKGLNEFPLYARGGMPIVMQPYTERMATTPLTHVIVRIFPGEAGKTRSTTLYQDDGETRAYLRGQSEETQIAYTQTDTEGFLRVGAAQGTFAGQPRSRSYELQFVGFGAALHAEVDGSDADVSYDGDADINTIQIPEKSLNQGTIARIQLP